jgi:hypothetical protein
MPDSSQATSSTSTADTALTDHCERGRFANCAQAINATPNKYRKVSNGQRAEET